MPRSAKDGAASLLIESSFREREKNVDAGKNVGASRSKGNNFETDIELTYSWLCEDDPEVDEIECARPGLCGGAESISLDRTLFCRLQSSDNLCCQVGASLSPEEIFCGYCAWAASDRLTNGRD